MKKILIVAGEPSADRHAAALVKAVHSKLPDVEFIGIGGPMMKQEGVRIIFDANKIAVVGISEVVRHLGMIKDAFNKVIRASRDEKVLLAVLIDFPDFNLRLAKKLDNLGIPLVYYISPQIWAWRKGRINKIKRYFKKVLVIFKFEESLYRTAGIDVKFVGHPLTNHVNLTAAPEEIRKKYNIPGNARVIAMLPGSRSSEIKRHLGIMIMAVELLKPSNSDIYPIIPVLSTHAEFVQNILKEYRFDAKVIVDDTYNAVGISYFAIVASGTATLETALLDVPMVIIYKVSFFSHMVAKLLLSITRIGIVNIITDEDIVPELVQSDLKPRKLANLVGKYLKNEEAYNKMKHDYLKLKSILGDSEASHEAAEEIVNIIALINEVQ